MKDYQMTVFGAGLAVALLVLTISFDLDIFESVLVWLHSLEDYEVDEFILPLFILLVCVVFDLLKARRKQTLEDEKIKIYKAMMSSAHHVLNNLLNQVQIFKMTAEATPGFDPQVLSLFDAVMDEASIQVEALGSISSIDEVTIRQSVSPS